MCLYRGIVIEDCTGVGTGVVVGWGGMTPPVAVGLGEGVGEGKGVALAEGVGVAPCGCPLDVGADRGPTLESFSQLGRVSPG